MAFFLDDSAPADFQISSSSESDPETLNYYDYETLQGGKQKLICPLCAQFKINFTCQKCLLTGKFVHSTQPSSALGNNTSRKSYNELKLKFNQIERQRKDIEDRCSGYLKKKDRIAHIVNQIETCQNQISLQKDLRDTIKRTIRNAERQTLETQIKIKDKVKHWPTYRSRLDNMAALYRHKTASLEKYKDYVNQRADYLQSVTKTRILQLKEYVFPIQMTATSSKDSFLSSTLTASDLWDDEEDDTVSALMANTSHFKLQPEQPSISFGSCYSICGPLGPTLPASGDYSAYTDLRDKEQSLGNAHGSSRNAAHSIGAALTYTTQFVNLIAYYLDLRLPHRLSYSEFANGDLMGGKFNRKVAKLNANIIHLCASQGVPTNNIQPRRTMSNILLLFDKKMCDLGRRGPFEVASQLAKSMEESIEKDLVIYEDNSSESDSESTDSFFPPDWETVQRATINEEMSAQNMTAHNNLSYYQSMGNNPYMSQNSDSFMRSRSGGGLMSSVTSFFKGWGN